MVVFYFPATFYTRVSPLNIDDECQISIVSLSTVCIYHLLDTHKCTGRVFGRMQIENKK